VNGNKVMEADIDVSNGVIHIIDGVLFPSWVSNSITDRVVADNDLSTLLALVGIAGLGAALAGPGELTLVAPTNSAFAKLPASTVNFLTSPGGKDTLTSILLYHVFPSIIVSSELSNGLTTPTLQGGTVTVSVNNAGIFFNDAKVVAADILANNGVVHKIDTVLTLMMDPEPTEPTLFELVAATPSLSTLGAAVVRAGLDGPLNSPGSFTVFAPNNDAFGDVPADIASTLFTNDAFLPHLTDLLLYHVLGTKITTNMHAMFDGQFLSPLNGESLAVTRPQLVINGNRIIARNIEASNGVANVINGVLIPSWVSNSITDRVVADSDLSTLLALVGLAGLGDALAGPGELTLVAPTNSAFAKLPASTVNFLTSSAGKATLTSILLYHVFPDIIVSSELSNGLTTSTLQGGIVTVSVNNAGIRFNNAKVVAADILANNGVVHKIDTVLDPSDGR
jgi:uncharacterized surface protein with fasciclin (FAS1) repeats